jgi:integrase
MIASRLGRAYGPGKLVKVQRGGGPGQWVLTYTDARAKRHRVALSTDKQVAERRRAELIRARDLELAGLGAVEGQSTPLDELRDVYLADLETRVGRSQFINVKLRLRMILEGLGVQRVRDLRVADVLRYRAERVKAGAANVTANSDVGALKAMLRWGVDAQLIAESPLRGIKRLPTGEAHEATPRRAMTDREIAAFEAAAREDDRCNAGVVQRRKPRSDAPRTFTLVSGSPRVRIPQAPLWAFLLGYGARYGEARTLAWGDVDLDARTVTLRPENTKTHRARCVPISREFAVELAQLRPLHARALGRAVSDADRVFLAPEGQPHREDTTNARRVFRRLLDAAGIERIDALGRKLDIHALRGTAATRLARRGVSMAVTQRLLGHKTVEMTAKHYTRLEVEDVRAAMEGASEVRRGAGWWGSRTR